MRLSKSHVPTLKEAPAEAEIPSHILMVRGGYLRKVAAGVYSFLPLGWRVIQKISRIVREELNRAGAQEVLLPAVTPGELWQESGRWDHYGEQLLRFKDRKGADFVIGPTHEETMVDLVRGDVRSYRQLPLNLFQIQTKFRDELRARAGLMRGREFIMKDGYSFHATEDDTRREYQNMYDAYTRIFRRCGLAFRAVEADTGAIGGSHSHEFQVLTETGEDALLACDSCDYAANVEQAKARPPVAAEPATAAIAKVATPGKRTIEEVSAFLGLKAENLVKTLIYLADGKPIAGGGAGGRQRRRGRDERPRGLRRTGRAVDSHLLRPRGLRPSVLHVRRERGRCPLPERRGQARFSADGVRRLPRRRRRRRLPALRAGPFHRLPWHRGWPGLLPRHQVLGAHEMQLPRRRWQRETDDHGHLWDRRHAHRRGRHRTEP
jgi:hypothetical protein